MMTLLRVTLICMSIVTYVGAQTTSSIGDIDSTGSGDYISTSESATASSATEVITSEAPSSETESSTSSSPSVNSTSSSTNTSIPAVENSTSPSVNSSSSTNTSVPAVGNATSSSLNATTATTTSKAAVVTENPCSNEPCPENSNCYTSGSSYECICFDGYMLDGDACIKVCEPKSYQVNNEEVYYDLTPQACDNLTLYPPTNRTFDVLFGQSQVGTTVTANITCNATCETNGAPGAIGYATCEASGTYSQPTWIDCSVTDPNTNQKLSTAIIATSEPDEVDAATVTGTVVVLQEVSTQDNISKDTADQFMAVTNNLLRSSGTGAQDQVQSNSDDIIQSVHDTTQNVFLGTLSNSYNTYENVQSDIAMGVAQTSSTSSAVRAEAKAGDSTVYYVLGGDVTLNLAYTGVSLSYSEPSPDQAYISATPGSERLSFVVYTSLEQLFQNTENILSSNIVFGVSGSTEYTMQFPITSDISIAVGATNKFNNTKRLECVKWDITKWSTAADCTNYAANHYVASCTCRESGEFTIRSVEIQVNDELSPGAIVGIVIGSLAGVAIIGGLVYYFVFRKKKNEKKKKNDMSDTDSATNEL